LGRRKPPAVSLVQCPESTPTGMIGRVLNVEKRLDRVAGGVVSGALAR
jgi:hypothetical protein